MSCPEDGNPSSPVEQPQPQPEANPEVPSTPEGDRGVGAAPAAETATPVPELDMELDAATLAELELTLDLAATALHATPPAADAPPTPGSTPAPGGGCDDADDADDLLVGPSNKRRRRAGDAEKAEKAAAREARKQVKAEQRRVAKEARDAERERAREEKRQRREEAGMDRLRQRTNRQVAASVRTAAVSLCEVFAQGIPPTQPQPSQPPLTSTPAPNSPATGDGTLLATPEGGSQATQGGTPILFAPPSATAFGSSEGGLTRTASSEGSGAAAPLRRTSSILMRQATLSQHAALHDEQALVREDSGPTQLSLATPTQGGGGGGGGEGAVQQEPIQALPTTSRAGRIHLMLRATQQAFPDSQEGGGGGESEEGSSDGEGSESFDMELEVLPEDDNATMHGIPEEVARGGGGGGGGAAESDAKKVEEQEETRRIQSRHELMRFRQVSSSIKFEEEVGKRGGGGGGGVAAPQEAECLFEKMERSASSLSCTPLSQMTSRKRLIRSGSGAHVRDESLTALKRQSVKDTSGIVMYTKDDSKGANAAGQPLTSDALQSLPKKSAPHLKKIMGSGGGGGGGTAAEQAAHNKRKR